MFIEVHGAVYKDKKKKSPLDPLLLFFSFCAVF